MATREERDRNRTARAAVAAAAVDASAVVVPGELTEDRLQVARPDLLELTAHEREQQQNARKQEGARRAPTGDKKNPKRLDKDFPEAHNTTATVRVLDPNDVPGRGPKRQDKTIIAQPVVARVLDPNAEGSEQPGPKRVEGDDVPRQQEEEEEEEAMQQVPAQVEEEKTSDQAPLAPGRPDDAPRAKVKEVPVIDPAEAKLKARLDAVQPTKVYLDKGARRKAEKVAKVKKAKEAAAAVAATETGTATGASAVRPASRKERTAAILAARKENERREAELYDMYYYFTGESFEQYKAAMKSSGPWPSFGEVVKVLQRKLQPFEQQEGGLYQEIIDYVWGDTYTQEAAAAISSSDEAYEKIPRRWTEDVYIVPSVFIQTRGLQDVLGSSSEMLRDKGQVESFLLKVGNLQGNDEVKSAILMYTRERHPDIYGQTQATARQKIADEAAEQRAKVAEKIVATFGEKRAEELKSREEVVTRKREEQAVRTTRKLKGFKRPLDPIVEEAEKGERVKRTQWSKEEQDTELYDMYYYFTGGSKEKYLNKLGQKEPSFGNVVSIIGAKLSIPNDQLENEIVRYVWGNDIPSILEDDDDTSLEEAYDTEEHRWRPGIYVIPIYYLAARNRVVDILKPKDDMLSGLNDIKSFLSDVLRLKEEEYKDVKSAILTYTQTQFPMIYLLVYGKRPGLNEDELYDMYYYFTGKSRAAFKKALEPNELSLKNVIGILAKELASTGVSQEEAVKTVMFQIWGNRKIPKEMGMNEAYAELPHRWHDNQYVIPEFYIKNNGVWDELRVDEIEDADYTDFLTKVYTLKGHDDVQTAIMNYTEERHPDIFREFMIEYAAQLPLGGDVEEEEEGRGGEGEEEKDNGDEEEQFVYPGDRKKKPVLSEGEEEQFVYPGDIGPPKVAKAKKPREVIDLTGALAHSLPSSDFEGDFDDNGTEEKDDNPPPALTRKRPAPDQAQPLNRPAPPGDSSSSSSSGESESGDDEPHRDEDPIKSSDGDEDDEEEDEEEEDDKEISAEFYDLYYYFTGFTVKMYKDDLDGRPESFETVVAMLEQELVDVNYTESRLYRNIAYYAWGRESKNEMPPLIRDSWPNVTLFALTRSYETIPHRWNSKVYVVPAGYLEEQRLNYILGEDLPDMLTNWGEMYDFLQQVANLEFGDDSVSDPALALVILKYTMRRHPTIYDAYLKLVKSEIMTPLVRKRLRILERIKKQNEKRDARAARRGQARVVEPDWGPEEQATGFAQFEPGDRRALNRVRLFMGMPTVSRVVPGTLVPPIDVVPQDHADWNFGQDADANESDELYDMYYYFTGETRKEFNAAMVGQIHSISSVFNVLLGKLGDTIEGGAEGLVNQIALYAWDDDDILPARLQQEKTLDALLDGYERRAGWSSNQYVVPEYYLKVSNVWGAFGDEFGVILNEREDIIEFLRLVVSLERTNPGVSKAILNYTQDRHPETYDRFNGGVRFEREVENYFTGPDSFIDKLRHLICRDEPFLRALGCPLSQLLTLRQFDRSDLDCLKRLCASINAGYQAIRKVNPNERPLSLSDYVTGPSKTIYDAPGALMDVLGRAFMSTEEYLFSDTELEMIDTLKKGGRGVDSPGIARVIALEDIVKPILDRRFRWEQPIILVDPNPRSNFGYNRKRFTDEGIKILDGIGLPRDGAFFIDGFWNLIFDHWHDLDWFAKDRKKHGGWDFVSFSFGLFGELRAKMWREDRLRAVRPPVQLDTEGFAMEIGEDNKFPLDKCTVELLTWFNLKKLKILPHAKTLFSVDDVNEYNVQLDNLATTLKMKPSTKPERLLAEYVEAAKKIKPADKMELSEQYNKLRNSIKPKAKDDETADGPFKRDKELSRRVPLKADGAEASVSTHELAKFMYQEVRTLRNIVGQITNLRGINVPFASCLVRIQNGLGQDPDNFDSEDLRVIELPADPTMGVFHNGTKWIEGLTELDKVAAYIESVSSMVQTLAVCQLGRLVESARPATAVPFSNALVDVFDAVKEKQDELSSTGTLTAATQVFEGLASEGRDFRPVTDAGMEAEDEKNKLIQYLKGVRTAIFRLTGATNWGELTSSASASQIKEMNELLYEIRAKFLKGADTETDITIALRMKSLEEDCEKAMDLDRIHETNIIFFDNLIAQFGVLFNEWCNKYGIRDPPGVPEERMWTSIWQMNPKLFRFLKELGDKYLKSTAKFRKIFLDYEPIASDFEGIKKAYDGLVNMNGVAYDMVNAAPAMSDKIKISMEQTEAFLDAVPREIANAVVDICKDTRVSGAERWRFVSIWERLQDLHDALNVAPGSSALFETGVIFFHAICEAGEVKPIPAVRGTDAPPPEQYEVPVKNNAFYNALTTTWNQESFEEMVKRFNKDRNRIVVSMIRGFIVDVIKCLVQLYKEHEALREAKNVAEGKLKDYEQQAKMQDLKKQFDLTRKTVELESRRILLYMLKTLHGVDATPGAHVSVKRPLTATIPYEDLLPFYAAGPDGSVLRCRECDDFEADITEQLRNHGAKTIGIYMCAFHAKRARRLFQVVIVTEFVLNDIFLVVLASKKPLSDDEKLLLLRDSPDM